MSSQCEAPEGPGASRRPEALLGVLRKTLLYPRWRARLRRRPPPSDALRLVRPLSGGQSVEAWLLPPLAPAEASVGPRLATPTPAPSAGGAREAARLVLFAHGNGELIDCWPLPLEPFRRAGHWVLLPEYRGYGRSGGQPGERVLTDDAEWFLERALARSGLRQRACVYFGRSLGGGVVGALSRRRPPGALALLSTFTSLRAVVAELGLPPSWSDDHYDTAGWLSSFEGPTLVVHGRFDPLVRYHHGRALQRLARRSRLLTLPHGHSVPLRGERLWQAFFALLAER